MSKTMRVAVIGGGVSGMAAAYVLAKEGVEVVVYEKQMSLGGQAKTATIDGTHLDLGFTIFARVCITQIFLTFRYSEDEEALLESLVSPSLAGGVRIVGPRDRGLGSLLSLPWFHGLLPFSLSFPLGSSFIEPFLGLAL
ncbi:hypothetical protein SASPL_109338 [Salvia splendens]|uniref:Cyclopropane-fatty-acyl-phospholipid synthase n=1 Tax=Salvia splendens TaxID=180675 RepID=A0A8X8YG53_SALSN|nr:hypothetical protein SASPL_109338 [Salvia splendens]